MTYIRPSPRQYETTDFHHMHKHHISKYIAITIYILTIGCENKTSTYENTMQGSIFGFVTDFATGEPVQNANVQLRPSGETTLTGYDGAYEFIDISNGTYFITVSKAEYTDLIDDYAIEVQNGRRMRRDVQIEKQPTSIRITDMNGNDISFLDFGSDPSMESKSFNIFNNGTVSINCQLIYSCNWISSVSSIPTSISPGQTVPITVKIDRTLLSYGQNVTNLTVASNNGSAEIIIKATSTTGNPPLVQIHQTNSGDITATSVLCEGYIQDTKGGEIEDCGFCYDTSPNPSLDDKAVRLGPNNNSFSYTINNLEPNTTYYIRAFAASNLGIGYSSDASITTISGLPICGETTITMLDPTTAIGESTAYSTNGYEIIETGFCWSTIQTPTITDQKVVAGYAESTLRAFINPLQPSQSYIVRAYAKNEFGIAYGPEKEFTSLSGLATVITESARLSGDEIITGGDITYDAGTAIIERGVCYGPSKSPDISGQRTYDGYGMGQYTSRIQKPSESGYLYIKAYATTKYGTSYGNEVSIYIP